MRKIAKTINIFHLSPLGNNSSVVCFHLAFVSSFYPSIFPFCKEEIRKLEAIIVIVKNLTFRITRHYVCGMVFARIECCVPEWS